MHIVSRSTRTFTVVLATALFLAASAGTLAVADDYVTRDVLPAGSTVAGLDISGLSRAEASELVGRELVSLSSAPIDVSAGEREYSLNPASVMNTDVESMVEAAFEPERSASLARRVVDRATGRSAGGSADATTAINEQALANWIATCASEIETPACDATLTVDGGKLVLTHSATGISVDETATAGALAEAIVSGGHSAQLVVATLYPTVTEDELGPEILVDISQRRLYLYVHGVLDKTYGVAVGTPGYPTPTGDFRIVQKKYLPSWYNPGSDWAADMPAYIGPGPSNPLGTRALYLNSPGIRIHGTSKDSSIGTAASHGCMRMHRWDIEDLYDRVEVGTKVHIVR